MLQSLKIKDADLDPHLAKKNILAHVKVFLSAGWSGFKIWIRIKGAIPADQMLVVWLTQSEPACNDHLGTCLQSWPCTCLQSFTGSSQHFSWGTCLHTYTHIALMILSYTYTRVAVQIRKIFTESGSYRYFGIVKLYKQSGKKYFKARAFTHSGEFFHFFR